MTSQVPCRSELNKIIQHWQLLSVWDGATVVCGGRVGVQDGHRTHIDTERRNPCKQGSMSSLLLRIETQESSADPIFYNK